MPNQRLNVKHPLENALFDPPLNENWHMQLSERAALMHVLNRMQPDVSVEIGTFLGGSLRPIAAVSRHVYTFDIDDRTISELSNVSFITGDSAKTLPPIIDEINRSNQEINFILVDGDHSEIGVKNDIFHCLRYRPKLRPTIILLHDSSNPAVRKGIIDAPWADSPYVHGLDLDFVPGMLYDRADIKGQIWGGFAAAVLLPEKRAGDVVVQASFEPSRLVLLKESIYSECGLS
jgi:hypothetical protein